MNTLQLEQLISGYIDNELSPNRKLEVENLLQNDPAAKTLYDEFVALRKEIRTIRRCNLPHNFQKQLFERIDRETISVSGKLVEKTTSVDFTQPTIAEPQPQWQNRESNKNLLARLKSPRAWALPAVAFLVGLAFFAFYPKDREVVIVPPTPPVAFDPAVLPQDPDEIEKLPPPLDVVDSIQGNATNRGLSYDKDGKPIVEVMLKLSPTARDSQYIPKLLADSGYSYTIRQNGNKAVTVYEFEMPADKLFPLLTLMYHSKRDEILDYKLPDGILTLLHRPVEPGLLEPTTEPTVIVRLNASDK